MESSAKKNSLVDKALIVGGVCVFVFLTIIFSPMIWMAVCLAMLPVIAMVFLITPTIHLNVIERQTEENRAK